MVIQSQAQPQLYYLHTQQLVPTLTQAARSTPTPNSSVFVLWVLHMVLQAATAQPPSLELAGSSQVSSAIDPVFGSTFSSTAASTNMAN